MERNLIIIAAVIAVLLIGGFWGLPLLTRAIFGSSHESKVNIIKAMDSDYVPGKEKDELVSRTVVDLEIFFPMGGAPNDVSDLIVQDESGRNIPVDWPREMPNFERTDLEDQAKTRWTLREVYFPKGFRKGALRNQVRHLADIKLGAVDIDTDSEK